MEQIYEMNMEDSIAKKLNKLNNIGKINDIELEFENE